jgi:hypothetical protein
METLFAYKYMEERTIDEEKKQKKQKTIAEIESKVEEILQQINKKS